MSRHVFVDVFKHGGRALHVAIGQRAVALGLFLRGGNLGDRGAAAMGKASAKFEHLSELDLHDNALTKSASWRHVKDLAKKVEWGWSQDRTRAR